MCVPPPPLYTKGVPPTPCPNANTIQPPNPPNLTIHYVICVCFPLHVLVSISRFPWQRLSCLFFNLRNPAQRQIVAMGCRCHCGTPRL